MSGPKLKKYGSLILLLLVLALAVFFLKAYYDGSFYSRESLQMYLLSFGIIAPLILTLIQAMQVVIPVLPGWLGSIVGAYAFGCMGGFWCNYIGISLGSIIAFFIARVYGQGIVRHMFSKKKYKKWTTRIAEKKSYTLFLFVAMLLPLFPDDFLCYFTGLTNMKPKKFILIILLGKPWCLLAYSIFFSHI